MNVVYTFPKIELKFAQPALSTGALHIKTMQKRRKHSSACVHIASIAYIYTNSL